MTSTTPAKPPRRTYKVLREGWLLGTHYAAGDTVDLYPAQAQYDLAPHGDMLAEAAPATSTTTDAE
jgi:hypothetical protein